MKVALTPREWLLKTKLSNGAIAYGKNKRGFGGRGVHIYGDALEPELQALEQFLDSTGVFVDVGANTGIYSLKAAKHFENSGCVLAIEPFPEILAMLHRSVQANGFTNVRLRNLGVCDRTTAKVLWMNFGAPTTFSAIKKDPTAAPFSVLMVSLDDLFEWEQLNRLDYLKIDAEGAEPNILIGARNVIEQYRPIIQLETRVVDFPIQLPRYAIFQAPRSPNKVCIPEEHAKIELPRQLGWQPISHAPYTG